MKTLKQFVEQGRCWTGYKPVPGKKPYSDDSCKKIKEDGAGGMGGAMPANNVSSGGIAGTGGAGGEPGVSKKRNPKMSFYQHRQPKV
jgi:hypothetical protein